ncbi:MAG: hypothetical protein AB7Q17_11800 [Phycisphaerae bacterium]
MFVELVTHRLPHRTPRSSAPPRHLPPAGRMSTGLLAPSFTPLESRDGGRLAGALWLLTGALLILLLSWSAAPRTLLLIS